MQNIRSMLLVHVLRDLRISQFGWDGLKSKNPKLDTESYTEPVQCKAVKLTGRQLHSKSVPTQLSGEHPKYFEFQLASRA